MFKHQGWVFKDYLSWHSNLRQHANRFLGLTYGVETGFYADVGLNADWNNL